MAGLCVKLCIVIDPDLPGHLAMILRRFFRGLSLFALWGALLSCPVVAAELDVRGEMRFYAELYPKNSMVSMLSVRGHMRTHMTGLMGEPVAPVQGAPAPGEMPVPPPAPPVPPAIPVPPPPPAPPVPAW